MTKQELLSGTEFEFLSEEQDHAIAWFSGRIDKFSIVFNGKLIYTSKTFKSFEKRLNSLINKWGLELSI